MNLNKTAFIKRKIDLKRQAVSLINAEIRGLFLQWFLIKIRQVLKRALISAFSHRLLGFRVTERMFNFFRLNRD